MQAKQQGTVEGPAQQDSRSAQEAPTHQLLSSLRRPFSRREQPQVQRPGGQAARLLVRAGRRKSSQAAAVQQRCAELGAAGPRQPLARCCWALILRPAVDQRSCAVLPGSSHLVGCSSASAHHLAPKGRRATAAAFLHCSAR